MKLIKIRLSGFLSYAEQVELDMEDLSFCSVTGVNGSGKSSLFQVIPWVLFGEVRIGNDKDTVVNDNCEEAFGEVEFYDTGMVHWRATRVRRRGASSSLKIEWMDYDDEVWVQFSDHTIAETQASIYSILGFDSNVFRSLSYVPDSTGSAFINANSNDRRAILMSLIPSMDEWQSLHWGTQARLSNAKHDLQTELGRRDSISQNIEESQSSVADVAAQIKASRTKAQVEKAITETEQKARSLENAISATQEGRVDIESQLRAIRAERKAHNAQIESDVTSLRRDIRKREQLDASISQSKTKVEELQESLETATVKLHNLESRSEDERAELKKQIKETRDSISETEKAIERSKSAISECERRVEEEEDHLEILRDQKKHGDGKCIVCESDLTEEQVKKLIRSTRTELKDLDERIETEKEKIQTLRQAVRRAQDRVSEYETDLDEIDAQLAKSRKSVDRISRDLESAEGALKRSQEDISEYESVASYQKQIDEALSRLQDESAEEGKLLEDLNKMDDDSPLATELSQVRSELARLRQELKTLEGLEGSLEHYKRQAESKADDLEKSERAIDRMRHDLENLEWIGSATNPKGIPSILIGEVLDTLQDRQNEMLSRLYGQNSMEVEYRQVKANKSNDGSKDVLDIIVHMSGSAERPIESCSSGERIRVTLTNLLAMIQVFNERNGNIIRNLFLDEALGVVDKDVVPVLLDALRDAISHDIVDSVAVIAHDDRVIEALPQNIHVKRDVSTGLSSELSISL